MLRKKPNPLLSFPPACQSPPWRTAGRHVLSGDPFDRCPIKAFGHDRLALLGSISILRNIIYREFIIACSHGKCNLGD